MKKEPIHRNLNTSFVNVSALVSYLRGLQFVGSIRLELSSYEADIIFTGSNKIIAREYDHIVGRISHGEQALERILIRSKEPHGRIHVYKSADGPAGHYNGSVFVDKIIVSGARSMAASDGGALARDGRRTVLPGRSESENALVLGALSDLLRIIDESLAKRNLSFGGAFRNACKTIAADFPFMTHSEEAIVYRNGKIRLTSNADSSSVAAAVFAALEPIFSRLRSDDKYAELLHPLVNKLRECAAARKPEYVSLGLMSRLETLLDEAD
ncbi:MAG TPA: hypothetical protein VMZ26_05465 [Pyrinomonadaceae bacterium]|nr:hypothetical protein [Pyrinomonadaceae bacterium]